MNKLQRITLGLALAAALAAGASTASAKQGEAPGRQRALSGTVLRIDLRARTLEVREDGTGRVVNVRVPEGATVRTNLATQPIMVIERLLPGMSIRTAVQ